MKGQQGFVLMAKRPLVGLFHTLARWQALHRTCAHVIWLVFLLSCLKRVGGEPIYALPLALLLGAMLLRHWPVRRM